MVSIRRILSTKTLAETPVMWSAAPLESQAALAEQRRDQLRRRLLKIEAEIAADAHRDQRPR